MNIKLSATLLSGVAAACPVDPAAAKEKAERPNIIIIVADDLGYGDLSCYGSTTISTPGIDRIAGDGLLFTQGFSTAATSTPSRYSLLTGMYPWKNQSAKILPGDAPLIIDPGQTTLPKVMKQAGYTTATIGKWHLGLGAGNVDWNRPIYPGAAEVGYDYSFIQAATNDRVPCVYIENGRTYKADANDPIMVSYKSNFEGEPTGRDNPELLKMHPSHGHDQSIVNGVSRIGYMKGGTDARWIDEEMTEVFLDKAETFITENKDNPFFMYYGLHQPHVPRVPNERFAGRSGMGPRGDAILEADWAVGQLLDLLDGLGLRENTLVVFSSDNGPVSDDGYKDMARELMGDHKMAGPLRGGKYSLYDGGTRVPFIISWPGRIKPGESDALVCQMDFLASFAAMAGVTLEGSHDSENTLRAFMGKSKKGRKNLVMEGAGNLAFRQGDWVLLPPSPGAAYSPLTDTETGRLSEYQLYNLKEDIGQKNNLAAGNPKRVAKMAAELEAVSGREYPDPKTETEK